jgi:hypothetical protein
MTEEDKPPRSQGDAEKVDKKAEPSTQPGPGYGGIPQPYRIKVLSGKKPAKHSEPDKEDGVIRQSHLIERFDPGDNGRD